MKTGLSLHHVAYWLKSQRTQIQRAMDISGFSVTYVNCKVVTVFVSLYLRMTELWLEIRTQTSCQLSYLKLKGRLIGSSNWKNREINDQVWFILCSSLGYRLDAETPQIVFILKLLSVHIHICKIQYLISIYDNFHHNLPGKRPEIHPNWTKLVTCLPPEQMTTNRKMECTYCLPYHN